MQSIHNFCYRDWKRLNRTEFRTENWRTEKDWTEAWVIFFQGLKTQSLKYQGTVTTPWFLLGVEGEGRAMPGTDASDLMAVAWVHSLSFEVSVAHTNCKLILRQKDVPLNVNFKPGLCKQSDVIHNCYCTGFCWECAGSFTSIRGHCFLCQLQTHFMSKKMPCSMSTPKTLTTICFKF